MEETTVLIIDDEPTVHDILAKYLAVSKYRVLHAYDGEQGIELMETRSPDLVLLDVQMPVMDGFATLAAIRKKSHLGEIPILLLTSLDRQHLKVKGLELGADDYVTKPFDMSELLARIKASLRKTARYRKAQGMLSGNLSDMSLTELLQSFEQGAKTATVLLHEMDAAVYMEDGRFVHARQGRFEGEPALERIFLMEKGSFSISFGELPADVPREPQSLMSILMGVLATVDEVNAHLARLPERARSLTVAGPMKDYPGLEDLPAGAVMTPEEVVILLEGSLKSNLRAMARGIKEGLLKPAPKAE